MTWLDMPRLTASGDMGRPAARLSGDGARCGDRASTGLRHRPAASARYPSALLRLRLCDRRCVRLIPIRDLLVLHSCAWRLLDMQTA